MNEKDTSESCKKSKCPKCMAEVYFVRHNGGSVWFDNLGGDWPRHGCFIIENSTDTFSAALLADVVMLSTAIEQGKSYWKVIDSSYAKNLREAAKAAGRAGAEKQIAKCKKDSETISRLIGPKGEKIVPKYHLFLSAVEKAKEEIKTDSAHRLVRFTYKAEVIVDVYKDETELRRRFRLLKPGVGCDVKRSYACAAIYPDGWVQLAAPV